MIACVKSVTHECPKHNDDYEQFLREYAELAEMKYRDSLVLAGMREAEDEDFVRRRWLPAFVSRLIAFVDDNGDGSAGALSLAQALRDAEPRGKGNTVLVWLGPAARQWLRGQRVQLGVFLGGQYVSAIRYL